MRLYGVDFTSAPRPRKPIVTACGRLQGRALHIEAVERYVTLADWADSLKRPGPWVMGCDFPFGLPRNFIDAVGWPQEWNDCVQHVAGLPKTEFEATIAAFRAQRPPGKKHPLRIPDQRVGACSPLMLHGVPVAKMFHVAAPCLLEASLHIVPCRPRPEDRVVIEVYPGAVARHLIGKAPYKGGSTAQALQRYEHRAALMQALQQTPPIARYGVQCRFSPALGAAMLADYSGDILDAVLCLLPTAWAASRLDGSYGVPSDADPLEVWLVDPATLRNPG